MSTSKVGPNYPITKSDKRTALPVVRTPWRLTNQWHLPRSRLVRKIQNTRSLRRSMQAGCVTKLAHTVIPCEFIYSIAASGPFDTSSSDIVTLSACPEMSTILKMYSYSFFNGIKVADSGGRLVSDVANVCIFILMYFGNTSGC